MSSVFPANTFHYKAHFAQYVANPIIQITLEHKNTLMLEALLRTTFNNRRKWNSVALATRNTY